jgi:hypothetical protein
MDLKTSSLIEAIKLAGSLPDGTFSTDDYVSFLNDALIMDLVPFMMRHREEFFVTYVDLDYNDVLSIPSDAISQKLADIVTVDSNGVILRNIPRISVESMSKDYRGLSMGFYLEGNKVKFYPKSYITDKIRMYYFKRPHFLISETNCALVTDIVGNVCQVEEIPSNLVNGSVLSIPSSVQPNDIVDGVTITNIDLNTNEITLSDVTDVQVGSYLCPLGKTVYAQVPLEASEILVQGAVIKAMVSLKDVNGAKLAGEMLAKAENTISSLLSPRVEGEVKKVVNTGGIFNVRRSRSIWR